jgi:predicted NUDIX family NTP pyrophosphohydrolase
LQEAFLKVEEIYSPSNQFSTTYVDDNGLNNGARALTAPRRALAQALPTSLQGCQIFLGTKYQNGGKIYQITASYTKYP